MINKVAKSVSLPPWMWDYLDYLAEEAKRKGEYPNRSEVMRDLIRASANAHPLSIDSNNAPPWSVKGQEG